jgi:hypothetical protein
MSTRGAKKIHFISIYAAEWKKATDVCLGGVSYACKTKQHRQKRNEKCAPTVSRDLQQQNYGAPTNSRLPLRNALLINSVRKKRIGCHCDSSYVHEQSSRLEARQLKKQSFHRRKNEVVLTQGYRWRMDGIDADDSKPQRCSIRNWLCCMKRLADGTVAYILQHNHDPNPGKSEAYKWTAIIHKKAANGVEKAHQIKQQWFLGRSLEATNMCPTIGALSFCAL